MHDVSNGLEAEIVGSCNEDDFAFVDLPISTSNISLSVRGRATISIYLSSDGWFDGKILVIKKRFLYFTARTRNEVEPIQPSRSTDQSIDRRSIDRSIDPKSIHHGP